MTLLELMCPFELSDQAFITCMSILLGVPVPHARMLRGTPGYEDIDVWGDSLLNDPRHAARSRKASHDRLAFCLSNLAARAGLSSSAIQSAVPVAQEDTFRRGDIVTSVAGLSNRSATYRFSSQTVLITDVTIVHNFSSQHIFKADSLSEAERLKNDLYQSDYNNLGMAFAPLACNSFGQQAPDLLRYQWVVADKAAQRVTAVLTFSLPATALHSGIPEEAAPQIQTFKRLRQNFFRQSSQEVLISILEGVCERVFGRTFAMQSYPEYPDFFRRLSVPWSPSFLHLAPGSSPPVSPPGSPLPPVPSPPPVSPSVPSSSGSPRSNGSAFSVSARPHTRSGRISMPSSRLSDFISPNPPTSGGLGGSRVRGRGGRGRGALRRGATAPGLGRLQRGGSVPGRQAGEARRPPRGGGRLSVSQRVSVGLGGVVPPLGRIPPSLRGGRGCWGGVGRGGQRHPASSRAASASVSVSVAR